MDATLTSYVVGAVATGAVGLIALAVRSFVESVRADIRQLLAQAAETEKRLALGNAAFQALHDTVREHGEALRQLEQGCHLCDTRLTKLEEG